MLTSDEHTDDLRAYLKSLTEAVDSAVTNRDVPVSRGERRHWPVLAGTAAVVLAVVGALVLLGMDERQSVSTADDAAVDVRQGWRTVEYGDVAFDVPPGWGEEQSSPCDLRMNVRGYYLLPIRTEVPAGSGCATPAEHWDTRDTLMLHLLPAESTYPVPSGAVTIVTDGGLEGFAWNNGERHTEYYFPDQRLRAATYSSLEPEVDPASVVATLRLADAQAHEAPDPGTRPPDVSSGPDDEWGPLTVVDGAPSGRRARTTGTLSIEENCVTLTGAGGQQRLLIWPSRATAWDPANGAVLYDSNGETVTLTDGETVSFGGGSIGSDSEAEYLSGPHPSCPASDAWLVGGLG